MGHEILLRVGISDKFLNGLSIDLTYFWHEKKKYVKQYDVIVIGAGAAGLIAAGRAAELGSRVLLVEKMERAGRKLLITGKGRCNITNEASVSDFFKHINPNGRYLKHAFGTFFSSDIVSLLKRFDVDTVAERGGRIFPVSNNASDVVGALLKWCSKGKVDFKYGSRVTKLLVSDGQMQGISYSFQGVEQEVFAPSVILCTGGNAYPATGSNGEGYHLAKAVGHTIEEVRPALVPLETAGSLAKELQGVSLKNVNASVWLNGKKYKEAFGEMLFTHFGLTGPIILTLSRFVVDEFKKGNVVEIGVDLKPALDEQKLDARLIRDLNDHGKKQVENIAKEWLPSKMIPVFFKHTGIDGTKEGHQIISKERRKLLLMMKDLRFKISGHRAFNEAIITAGGINTSQIDSKTMESKLVKGLYFAGEVLDLDADTGGFNLQIAWSTGWLAAQSCYNK